MALARWRNFRALRRSCFSRRRPWQPAFRTVKKALKREGLNHLIVWALKDNEAACAFYGGLGGAIVAAAPERYGEVSLTRIAFVWGVNVKSSKA